MPWKRPIKALVLVVTIGFMIDSSWDAYNQFGRGADFALAAVYDVQQAPDARNPFNTSIVSIDSRGVISLWPDTRDTSARQTVLAVLEDHTLVLGPSGVSGRLEVLDRTDDTVVLKGRMFGQEVAWTLTKRSSELLDRGFNWVTEVPYNR